MALACVFDLFRTRHAPVARRRDHLQLRIQRAGRHVEPDLVVALAGATVRDGRGLLDFGDLDQLLADERAAERGGHRVAVLVDGVGLERGQDEIARELLADIEHVRPDGAGGERAVADFLELPALSHVERHRDDFGLVPLGHPRNGHRRIKTTGISQYDPFHQRGSLGEQ